jgi:sn-glycerol 3-phosphate transport system substrate-binding protein
MHKPIRWGAVTLLTAALLAAACGGGNGNDTAARGGDRDLPACPIGALEDATGPVEVLLWHFLAAETGKALNELADEYNASQDKVRVRVESQGTEGRELWDKYRAGIATGDLPAIAVADDTVTLDIVDSGTVLPAQSCIEADDYDTSDFVEAAMRYYTIDEVLYPASLNLSSALLYYNKNHFRRANLDAETAPSTLADVREYAQQIKDAGVVERPVVLKVGPPLIEMWLTGAGVPIVDNDNGRGDGETTEAAFDTETTVELYTWFQEMERDGLLEVVPDTPGQIGQYLAMATQSGSMTIETSTAATSIEAFLGGDTSVADDAGADVDASEVDVDVSQLDIGAAVVPGIEEAGQVQMGGGAWYITNTTPPEVQAAAWDFMKFFNSVPSQVTWNLQGSYLPYNSAAIGQPELQQRWTTTVAGRWLAVAYDQLLNGVDPAFPGPLIGPYDAFRDSIRRSVEALIFGGQSPQAAVTGAAEQTTTALQRYAEESF